MGSIPLNHGRLREQIARASPKKTGGRKSEETKTSGPENASSVHEAKNVSPDTGSPVQAQTWQGYNQIGQNPIKPRGNEPKTSPEELKEAARAFNIARHSREACTQFIDGPDFSYQLLETLDKDGQSPTIYGPLRQDVPLRQKYMDLRKKRSSYDPERGEFKPPTESEKMKEIAELTEFARTNEPIHEQEKQTYGRIVAQNRLSRDQVIDPASQWPTNTTVYASTMQDDMNPRENGGNYYPLLNKTLDQYPSLEEAHRHIQDNGISDPETGEKGMVQFPLSSLERVDGFHTNDSSRPTKMIMVQGDVMNEKEYADAANARKANREMAVKLGVKESDITYVTSTGDGEAFSQQLNNAFKEAKAFCAEHKGEKPQVLMTYFGHGATGTSENGVINEDKVLQKGVDPGLAALQGAYEGFIIGRHSARDIMDRTSVEENTKIKTWAKNVVTETQLKAMVQQNLSPENSECSAVALVFMGCTTGSLIN